MSAVAAPEADLPPHVRPDLAVDFDVYAPPGGRADFHGAWEVLQAPDTPPIVWSVRNGGHWMPTRGPLIAAMYADSARFSNRYSFVPKDVAKDFFGIPQSLDPPLHQPFRMLLNSVLGPKIVNRMADEIRTLATGLIAGIRRQGRCDFTKAYAEVLPVRIFMRLVDLPIADAPMLVEVNNHIIRPGGAMTVLEATERLHDYLRGPVAARLGGSGDDMLSRMLNGRVEGRMLTLDEGVHLAKTVLQGGIDTVSNLLSFAMHFLATSPGHRRELIVDRSLVPAAVDEMIRRFPVVATGRMVAADMVYEGVEMRRGDAVMLATPFHGLDPAENPQPLSVDFHRSARAHSTFGAGIHRCPGAYLARLEVQITLEEWLAQIPDFAIDGAVAFEGGVIATVSTLPLAWPV